MKLFNGAHIETIEQNRSILEKLFIDFVWIISKNAVNINRCCRCYIADLMERIRDHKIFFGRIFRSNKEQRSAAVFLLKTGLSQTSSGKDFIGSMISNYP